MEIKRKKPWVPLDLIKYLKIYVIAVCFSYKDLLDYLAIDV